MTCASTLKNTHVRTDHRAHVIELPAAQNLVTIVTLFFRVCFNKREYEKK